MCANRVALTATVIGLDHDFEDWCAYHLRHFDRIILWLDDHQESNSPHLPSHPSILALPGNQCASSTQHTNMMRCQNANADAAVKLCLEAGIEWLVHLDDDEIFYPGSDDIWDADAGRIVFQNHEVCPLWEAEYLFRGLRYFRINGRSHVRFYSNGKCAVRCGPRVRSAGAHRFKGFEGPSIKTDTPCVLHYVCATYASWLKKYRRLGNFDSFWYDDPSMPITLPFHLDSRDAYLSALTSGDLSIARAFFEKYVLPEAELAKLEADGNIRCLDPLGDDTRSSATAEPISAAL